MTKKNPSRVRILMMPYQEEEDSGPVDYSGPATVLTGLPRTIRRHELRLIVPLADSTIYELEKRGEFPRRFDLTPRCVVLDLAEVEAWLEQRRSHYSSAAAPNNSWMSASSTGERLSTSGSQLQTFVGTGPLSARVRR